MTLAEMPSKPSTAARARRIAQTLIAYAAVLENADAPAWQRDAAIAFIDRMFAASRESSLDAIITTDLHSSINMAANLLAAHVEPERDDEHQREAAVAWYAKYGLDDFARRWPEHAQKIAPVDYGKCVERWFAGRGGARQRDVAGHDRGELVNVVERQCGLSGSVSKTKKAIGAPVRRVVDGQPSE